MIFFKNKSGDRAKREDLCGVILMYHRVVRTDSDPWGLCVSPEHFEQHLAYLKRSEYQLSSLADIQKRPGFWRNHKRIAVTFDDGYADNYINARPLLERYGIPATFFIVSGAVGSGEEFWWDHLERLMIKGSGFPARLTLGIAGEKKEWERPGNTQAEREKLYRDIWEAVSVLPFEEKKAAMKALEAQIDTIPPVRQECLPMTREQVRALAGNPLFAVGSHTARHPFLDRLSKEEQQEEIGDSKAVLEKVTGKVIDLFSCPHGRYNDETVDLLKKNRYRLACVSGNNNVFANSSPFALTRRVVENWDTREFQKKIQEWLAQ